MANDDWRSETSERLKSSRIFQLLVENAGDSAAGKRAIALVEDLVFDAYQQTKTVVLNMPEYTLHDGEHLFRVLHLMERLAGEDLLSKLTPPELLLLIATAFYHDIGMAPSQEDVRIWRRYWDAEREDLEHNESFRSFARFCDSFPQSLKEIRQAVNAGRHSAADSLKSHLVSEYIRLTHADRARRTIEDKWNGKIRFRDTDLTVEFAELCFSHNQSALRLLECDHALDRKSVV